MDIVLFTSFYPYGKGETFLESEIKHLSENFDNVYIISNSKIKKQTRKIPDNVILVRAGRDKHFFSSLIYGFVSLFFPSTFKEIFKGGKTSKLNIIQRTKYIARTNMIIFRLKRVMKRLNLKNENTIGYSYWLSNSAYFMSKNKKYFNKIISRAHAYEVRSYIPFREEINNKMDEIYFISEYTNNAYNRLLDQYEIGNKSNQHISKLGISYNDKINVPNENIFRIISCSNIIPLKRLDLIIDSLRKVQSKDYPIEWHHFGWGENEEQIIKYAKKQLLDKENFHFTFHGWVQNKEIMKYYENNGVDLFINLSDIEGIPVSVMEAMSYGIPSIARDVGGISELVINGLNGILLPENTDANFISLKINNLIDAKRRNLDYFNRKKVKQFIDENYNANKNYEDFYNKILSEYNE